MTKLKKLILKLLGYPDHILQLLNEMEKSKYDNFFVTPFEDTYYNLQNQNGELIQRIEFNSNLEKTAFVCGVRTALQLVGVEFRDTNQEPQDSVDFDFKNATHSGDPKKLN